MIKIFETSKLKSLDQYTVDNEPISSIDLVERAAVTFANEFKRNFSKQRRVIVFAGQGNNGADALAVARLLAEESYRTEVYLFNPGQRLSPDCEENKQRILADEKVRLYEVIDDFDPPELTEHDVVIDGLFGSGLNRPLTGGYAAVVGYINQSNATVVSIDMPSGLFGEDNLSNNPDSIIRAKMTLTFEFPKLAMLLPENEAYVGRWKVLPIGLHPDIIQKTPTAYLMVTDEDMERLIRPRSRFAHKGDFGHALLVAGGKGRMGAALLAASACMHSGVGKLTVHLPQRGEMVLQTAVPEAMIDLDADRDRITTLPDSLREFDTIAIGPGIGTDERTASLLGRLLRSVDQPLLLDADALNLLARNRELIPLLPPGTVLTPHPREFDRLFGESANGYDRRQARHLYRPQGRLYGRLRAAGTDLFQHHRQPWHGDGWQWRRADGCHRRTHGAALRSGQGSHHRRLPARFGGRSGRGAVVGGESGGQRHCPRTGPGLPYATGGRLTDIPRAVTTNGPP